MRNAFERPSGVQSRLGQDRRYGTADWRPRGLRHSFVSLLSDSGIPIGEISRVAGHNSTAVTEQVYRQQIRPVVRAGAVVVDGLFGTL